MIIEKPSVSMEEPFTIVDEPSIVMENTLKIKITR